MPNEEFNEFNEMMNKKVTSITMRGDQWGPVMAMMLAACPHAPEFNSILIEMIKQLAWPDEIFDKAEKPKE